MNLQIKFICHDCMGTNKHQRGTPGFELLDCEWLVFSDAHRHMIQHPDHWVDTVIEELSDEE